MAEMLEKKNTHTMKESCGAVAIIRVMDNGKLVWVGSRGYLERRVLEIY